MKTLITVYFSYQFIVNECVLSNLCHKKPIIYYSLICVTMIIHNHTYMNIFLTYNINKGKYKGIKYHSIYNINNLLIQFVLLLLVYFYLTNKSYQK